MIEKYIELKETSGGKKILSRSCGEYYWAELHLPRPEQRVLAGPYEEMQISFSPYSSVPWFCLIIFFCDVTTKCFLELSSSFSGDKLEWNGCDMIMEHDITEKNKEGVSCC